MVLSPVGTDKLLNISGHAKRSNATPTPPTNIRASIATHAADEWQHESQQSLASNERWRSCANFQHGPLASHVSVRTFRQFGSLASYVKWIITFNGFMNFLTKTEVNNCHAEKSSPSF